MLLDQNLEGRVEFAFSSDLPNNDLQSQGASGFSHVFQLILDVCNIWIYQHADHGPGRNQLVQQFKLLRQQRTGELTYTSDVATWAVEAGDQAKLDRVAAHRKY